jgi:hypothetical protein
VGDAEGEPWGGHVYISYFWRRRFIANDEYDMFMNVLIWPSLCKSVATDLLSPHHLAVKT